MNQFMIGFITGMIAIVSIGVLDVVIFKDEAINKKVSDFRVYLWASFIEIMMFLMGYFLGSSK